jgi:hypothetical protein
MNNYTAIHNAYTYGYLLNYVCLFLPLLAINGYI